MLGLGSVDEGVTARDVRDALARLMMEVFMADQGSSSLALKWHSKWHSYLCLLELKLAHELGDLGLEGGLLAEPLVLFFGHVSRLEPNGRGGFVRLGGELLLLHSQGCLLGFETPLLSGEGARCGVVGGIDGRGLAPRLLLPSEEASAAVLFMRMENLELLEIELRREIERWTIIGGGGGEVWSGGAAGALVGSSRLLFLELCRIVLHRRFRLAGDGVCLLALEILDLGAECRRALIVLRHRRLTLCLHRRLHRRL